MIDIPVTVVLASSSPTRRTLLVRLIADFEVVDPEVEEDSIAAGDPWRLTVARAEAKARQVARRRPDALVIAAETLAVCDGEAIGKAKDRADAARILEKLSRVAHHVVTGLFVIAPDARELSRCVATEVRMKRTTPGRIAALAAMPGALTAAGAYRIQPDDPNIESINGSVTSVMGLPLEALREVLLSLYPPQQSG